MRIQDGVITGKKRNGVLVSAEMPKIETELPEFKSEEELKMEALNEATGLK